jgi:hypothetical protein
MKRAAGPVKISGMPRMVALFSSHAPLKGPTSNTKRLGTKMKPMEKAVARA